MCSRVVVMEVFLEVFEVIVMVLLLFRRIFRRAQGVMVLLLWRARVVVIEAFLEVFQVIVMVLLIRQAYGVMVFLFRRASSLRLKLPFASKATDIPFHPTVIPFHLVTFVPDSQGGILIQLAILVLVLQFVVVADVFVPLLFVRQLLAVRPSAERRGGVRAG